MTAAAQGLPSRPWTWGVAALAVAVTLCILRFGFDRPAMRETVNVPHRVAIVDEPPARPVMPQEDTAPEPLRDLDESLAMDDGAVTDDTGPPPIDDVLGLEGDAEAGFDAFGLRSKRGGRDILLDVQAAGRPYSAGAITAYALRLADEIESNLRAAPELRVADYAIRVRVWVDTDGHVQRCELLGSTGRAGVDERLEDVMSHSRVHAGPPPRDFPNPVELFVRSRRAHVDAG